MPLYQVMVGVWCAMSATKIIGLIVSETKFPILYHRKSGNIFPITKAMTSLKQDSATTPLTNRESASSPAGFFGRKQ
jgi:hypothetical protein